MSYTEAQLKSAVDAVFDQYDKDKNGTLDKAEVSALINDALKHMKSNRSATNDEIEQLFNAVDSSKDGKVSKPELYEIFKKVVATCNK